MFKEKKEKTIKEFQEVDARINQLTQQINQLSVAREQIRGKLILIEEMEKEPSRASKRRVENLEKKEIKKEIKK